MRIGMEKLFLAAILILNFKSQEAFQCPQSDLVSTNCQRSQLELDIYLERFPKEDDSWEDFAGFYLFPKDSNTSSDFIRPTVLNQVEKKIRYTFPYDELPTPSDENGTLSLKKNVQLEVIWPIKFSDENPSSYIWPIAAECNFVNRRNITTPPVRFKKSSPESSGITAEASSLDTENPDRIKFTIAIPENITAIPVHCIITPTTFGFVPNFENQNDPQVCHIFQNETALKENCSFAGTSVDMAVNVTLEEKPEEDLYHFEWNRLSFGASSMTAFCKIRYCLNEDDDACVFKFETDQDTTEPTTATTTESTTATTTGSAPVPMSKTRNSRVNSVAKQQYDDSHRFDFVVQKNYDTYTSTDTTISAASPTSANTTIASTRTTGTPKPPLPSLRTPEVCLKAEVLYPIVGVILGLSLIGVIMLMYLHNKLIQIGKKKDKQSVPEIILANEPTAIRRPKLNTSSN